MSSKIFLQTLQSKLKGGNARSIHLNALPGRLATRLDLKQLDLIESKLASSFLNILLTKPTFDFKISFDQIDLNELNADAQKKLSVVAKRLNSIIIENEDYFKEHGIKTLGFGYPILIKRSTKDPTKIIKAPLFIWPLEAIKSKTKVNEWSLLRNKMVTLDGKIRDADIHSVSINEVLYSFIKGEDGIILPNFTSEALEDSLIDSNELVEACAEVLQALNSNSKAEQLKIISNNFQTTVTELPDATHIDSIANNKAYIHFGGILGLFRAQKESIITDISKLIDRFDEFQFDNLVIENLSTTPFSAVDTDPSQQAIISTLGINANQIIQGPPGTGKSQSLTALITNALANGLKCLVVCEKKTALDVIKRNVLRTNTQMGALVGVIDDVNDDREAIVDSVRDRQNGFPFALPLKQAQNRYDSAKFNLKNSADLINIQHKALATPVYNDKRWSQLVGRYLKLRKKYNEVPLRNILVRNNFKLHKDGNELEDLLTILKRSNNLYNQSKSIHSIFESLNDNLFSGISVGEARAKIEEFISTANPKLPVLLSEVKTIQNEGRTWIVNFSQAIPLTIRKETEDFDGFIKGDEIIRKNLPEFFFHEDRLSKLLITLETIKVQAVQIKQHYQEGLNLHYNTYQQQLKDVLMSYLSFADNSIASYGNSILENTKGAKIKTRIYSLFSSRHKQIQQTRLNIRNKVAEVRQTHLQKSYISHQYNDNIETSNLDDYLANIRDLQQKVVIWEKEYPSTISSYLSNISELNFHQDFSSLKIEVTPLLQQFREIERKLFEDYEVKAMTNASDVNALIDTVPYLIKEVKKQQEYFKSFREQVKLSSKNYDSLETQLSNIWKNKETESILGGQLMKCNSLNDIGIACESINATLIETTKYLQDFRSYHEWHSYYLSLTPSERQLVNTISLNQKNSWADAFECWYLFWVLSLNEPTNLPKSDHELFQYKENKNDFNKAQLDSIVAYWGNRQTASVNNCKLKGLTINSLFNKKGSKGTRRNSLRTIIKSEFELFTDFFPVLLLNPSVCSSILPLEEGIFDLVIFDEASQLRLEDTFAALVRGKAKIVSGDKHQMAPSSYFEGSGALLDPHDDEDGEDNDEDGISTYATRASDRNLADSESLLAYAVDKNFKESYLNVHYRSQHPFLIDFSNHAFYGNRLIPVPAKLQYTPIEYFQVDGQYEGQVNIAEALKVVALLKQIVKANENDTCPTIGVATFNIYQRNLILEEIGKEKQIDLQFDSLMAKLGSTFFVKNLENIQGDERDVIIISTTFGRKANHTFTQNFGPIIQGKGHRMLNVIVTRARQKVYVCTSFPQEYVSQYPQLIQQKGNKGRGILYAYLAYAKAVSENSTELREGLLQILTQHCVDKHYDVSEISLGSESPFEDEVYERLTGHIGAERIEQQFKVGGFRIDMIIRHKETGEPIIALECDGAKYHTSPEAYAWDCFRQSQLEQFGFKFYRIWSTKWWDAADRELELLLDFIRMQDTNTKT